MAKNKNSFVLYADLIGTIEELTDDEAGRLIKHILRYVNDLEPVTDDKIVKVVFEPIKLSLKRDLKKWKSEKKKRSVSGRKGGLKSGLVRGSQSQSNEGVLHVASKNEANEAVSVSVSVPVSVSVIDSILSESEVGSTIQFCLITLKREYTSARLAELWQAFLINNGKEFYATRQKKINHFRNWIKTQPYDSDRKLPKQSINRKDKGASELLDDFKSELGAYAGAGNNQS